MSQIAPDHGYEQGHINIHCTHFISSKALLANRGTPVLGRAPPAPQDLWESPSLVIWTLMDMEKHHPDPPVGKDLSHPSAAKSHIPQEHILPRTAHTQWLVEEGCKSLTITAHSDNSDRPRATWAPNGAGQSSIYSASQFNFSIRLILLPAPSLIGTDF